jgi:hypothetical protein
MPSPKSTSQEKPETPEDVPTSPPPVVTPQAPAPRPDTWDLIVRDSAGEFTLEFPSEQTRKDSRALLTRKFISGIEPVETVNRGAYFSMNLNGVFVVDGVTKHS